MLPQLSEIGAGKWGPFVEIRLLFPYIYIRTFINREYVKAKRIC